MSAYRLLWGLPLLTSVAAFGLQCPVDPLARFTELGGDPERKIVDVSAEQSEANYDSATFIGKVILQQGDKHLFSPKLIYQRENEKIETFGATTFGSPTLAATGGNIDYDLSSRIISVEDAAYYLKTGNGTALGQAESAEFDLQDNSSTFQQPTWTTCPRNDQVWSLKADQLTLNRTDGMATARNVTFRIKDVPVFYLPYFTFPTTNERASGFLVPSVSFSDLNGLSLNIPYYWNIAPNQDMTLNLRPITERGVMLGAEYRYLGERQNGLIAGSFLPSDRKYEGNRWQVHGNYRYEFNDQWHADVLYQQVSDVDFIQDFSAPHLRSDEWFQERHAALRGETPYGNLLFQVQDYQRINPNILPEQKPYARLPQLRYTYDGENGGWRYGVSGELVRFHKPDALDGWRANISSDIAYRWSSDYGYLEPKLSASMTQYALDNTTNAYPEKNPSNVLPTFSIDGKLVFEREANVFGNSWTQTLEPRLFYLYTPYRDQSNIPNFDTSQRSQSWDWLFARNRFIGGDRVGDANQLTTAVTTRFFDHEDGQEKLRLSLGQIQYFANRRVTLPGQEIRDAGRSDLIAEGAYNIDRHWNLRGLSFWDMDNRQNRRSLIDLRYNLDQDRFAGLSHRYMQDNYDQLSLYSVWRFNSRWRGFLRQDYSLRHNHSLNTLAGVEYSDCCWAWRLLGKRYRDDPADSKVHNALYLEFVLKGLGRLGNGSSSVLEHEISGYRPLAEERSF